MKTKPIRSRDSIEVALESIRIREGFWSKRRQVNTKTALTHQWEQLESTGRLDNFRKAARQMEGHHQGFFYDDSDVHKWAEAAFISDDGSDNPVLNSMLDEYVTLITNAQEADGYLFTYNQLCFPGQRWNNLQIESELYTLGHFIEAGIAARLYSDDRKLFSAVTKCADLIADVFSEASPLRTPGHQEIEIALIRLFHVTKNTRYFKMAERFLEKRGKTPFFGYFLLRQFINHTRRSKQVAKLKGETESDGKLGFDMSETLSGKEPPFISLRANIQFLTGKYHQQHAPIRKMDEPVGHAVRWAYLQTAVTMLYLETGDATILASLETSWDNMVRKKMYVTGGIGSLPVVEGFGRSWELDNEFAYAETCAAIGSIFWNWQMILATGEAKYAELLEWQLYNASAVGIAQQGNAYLYRNPLMSTGGLARKPWFGTACCPGNIARLWAQIGKYIVSTEKEALTLHQYIDSEMDLQFPGDSDIIKITMGTGLPWNGNIDISMKLRHSKTFRLRLRIPGWARTWQVKIDDQIVENGKKSFPSVQTAGGYSPYEAFYLDLERSWNEHTSIELLFEMSTVRHQPHPKVKSNTGKIAISRGPIVYCLEDIDNSAAGVPDATLSLDSSFAEHHNSNLFDGITTLDSTDSAGNRLVFIPYFCWANRALSKMQVWVNVDQ
ncbi:MAG: glycoside hydrolase family 127 protein [Desulfobacterales bacterium]|nr:glycoside hydrolase family 127 protein [Desulfobacterales bacterium]